MSLSSAALFLTALFALFTLSACTTVDLSQGQSDAAPVELTDAQQSLRDLALELEILSEERGWVEADGMGERARRWADMLLHGVSGKSEEAASNPYQSYLENAGAGAADRTAAFLTDIRDAQTLMTALNDAASSVAAGAGDQASLTEDLRILEASAQRAIRIEMFFTSVLDQAGPEGLGSRNTLDRAVSSLGDTAERMAALADALADRRRSLQPAPAVS